MKCRCVRNDVKCFKTMLLPNCDQQIMLINFYEREHSYTPCLHHNGGLSTQKTQLDHITDTDRSSGNKLHSTGILQSVNL